MERIILHWTAGTNVASDMDRRHYHKLIEGDGAVVDGHHEIADNIVTSDGDYAAHTLRLNTKSIGNGLCGMAGAKESPFDPGRYPINEHQFDAGCELIADQAVTYRITVARRTVMTHAEVQPTLGVRQRGKWDITRLPWLPNLRGAIPVGDYMRSRVLDYLGRPGHERMPLLVRGDKGDLVARLQAALVRSGEKIAVDGDFGPRTEAAVLRFQSRQGLSVDGMVGAETWGALE